MPHCRRKNATPAQQVQSPIALALGVHHTRYAANCNRLTAFWTIGPPKRIRKKLNRDRLNRSAFIEIAEPADNFRLRLETVLPDPDQIPDFYFLIKFSLKCFGGCIAESVPRFAGVDAVLRDLYFPCRLCRNRSECATRAMPHT